MGKKIFTFMILISLIPVIIGSVILIKKISFISSAKSATGKIINFSQQRGTGDDHMTVYYYPVYSFIDESGKQIIITSNVGTNRPRYKIGDKVELLYLVNNPEKAIINNFVNKWLASTILLSVGFFIFIIMLIIRIAISRR